MRGASQHIVADWEEDGAAILLHERTYPYSEVACPNLSVCAIDIAYVHELTQMDACLVECRVRGDSGCTYRLQAEAVPACSSPFRRLLARCRTSVGS